MRLEGGADSRVARGTGRRAGRVRWLPVMSMPTARPTGPSKPPSVPDTVIPRPNVSSSHRRARSCREARLIPCGPGDQHRFRHSTRWDTFRIRQIVRLERSLPLSRVADAEASVRVDRFKQGRDEPFLIEVNNLAFAGHPEDGNLTSVDLAARTTRPWFDAAGVFVARSKAQVVGFCWTKLHPERLGEVYVIAVSPTARDRQIGGVLLAARNLDDLHRRRGQRVLCSGWSAPTTQRKGSTPGWAFAPCSSTRNLHWPALSQIADHTTDRTRRALRFR